MIPEPTGTEWDCMLDEAGPTPLALSATTVTEEQAREKRVAWWRRFAHFWLLVGKNFVRNRCPVRASALAYTTLLAMIPLLAVATFVTTYFLKNEVEKPVAMLVDQVVANLAPQLNLEIKGEDEQAAETSDSRRSQVGSGDRAEKVRTYNFPQDRITDHRVGVTGHGIERVLSGDLDEFTAALQADEKRRGLEAA